jgi:ribosomal RNA assembly protein
MIQILRVPVRRIPILLGKKGEVKKKIELSTKTRLFVQKTGEVSIEGETEGLLTASEVVKAIARGFSPEKAFLLFNEEYQLYIISLDGETKKTIVRLKSRVIGRKGGAKTIIENYTNCVISVYGKTVSIIGLSSGVNKAAAAVEGLLKGRTHGYIFKKLESF